MIQFPIPPEYCLIINAFNQTSSLRGAAQVLGTDPASLVRKVQKISADYGFLQKTGNRWIVTEAGRRVAQWTDELINSQAKLLDQRQYYRIAAFSWLADEMIIPRFHLLNRMFSPKHAWAIKMVATDLEQEILHGRSDFVITGHAPNDPTIAHKRISSHPWIVVIPYSWKKKIKNLTKSQIQEFLNAQPFIKHPQMAPEQILGFSPVTISELSIDGVVGLRSGVAAGLGWSVIPDMATRSYVKDKKIHPLELNTHLVDDVSVWWLRSRKDTSSLSRIICQWVSDFKED